MTARGKLEETVMWHSRTRNDLIIEVWEKLDCESVGGSEIEAIMEAVRGKFGSGAVGSPTRIARLLADEGAVLRHSEILKMFVDRHQNGPYDAAFRNILRLESLKSALASLRNLENLRKKYAAEGDREGLRLIRETAGKGKAKAIADSVSKKLNPDARLRAGKSRTGLRSGCNRRSFSRIGSRFVASRPRFATCSEMMSRI